MGVAFFVGLLEPVDGPVVIAGVKIAQGDGAWQVDPHQSGIRDAAGFFVPRSQEIGKAPLRPLVAALSQALLECRHSLRIAGDPQSRCAASCSSRIPLMYINVLNAAAVSSAGIRLQRQRGIGRGEGFIAAPLVHQDQCEYEPW